jgi:serine/threonine protein kinase
VLEYDNQSLITEFCNHGSLFDVLHDAQFARLTEKHRKSIAIETAIGMEYLHSKGIVHRDLKPGNLLLTSDYSVRIADFGLSRDLASAGSMTGLGTVLYAAPEMLKQDLHGKPADVW